MSFKKYKNRITICSFNSEQTENCSRLSALRWRHYRFIDGKLNFKQLELEIFFIGIAVSAICTFQLHSKPLFSFETHKIPMYFHLLSSKLDKEEQLPSINFLHNT